MEAAGIVEHQLSSEDDGRVATGVRSAHLGGRCTMVGVDRDMRDWLRSLAVHPDSSAPPAHPQELSTEGAAYLVQIANDGTLAAALAEIAAAEPELAG